MKSSFHQITVHHDTIPLTASVTSSGLFEWLKMPQGSSTAPGWFCKVVNEVIKNSRGVASYLDDLIVFDDTPATHVGTMRALFERFRTHNLKLTPPKATIGATEADFLGHITVPSYYREFLPNMAKRIRPLTTLLKKQEKFIFTPSMEQAVRVLLAELANAPVLVYPHWDAVSDGSRPFHLYCDASRDGFGGTLVQEQPDGSIRPLVFISRVTLDSEHHWTPLDLEAGSIVWYIKRLRDGSRPFHLYCDASRDGFGGTLVQEQPDGSIRPLVFISRVTLDSEHHWTPLDLEAGSIVWYIKRLRGSLWGTKFRIFTDHKSLEHFVKVGENNARVQRWQEFLTAYNYTLKYRKSSANGNADFLSRLPVAAAECDRSGRSHLTPAEDEEAVFFIRSCDLTPSGDRAAGIGLGGLAPCTADFADFRRHGIPFVGLPVESFVWQRLSVLL
ncbi:unnamed protein product [Ectocarpus sp. CCAP 1310/34]|nr:unnamed protein product [Ectocarpus sp. CCAP 1310/34]